MLDYSKSRGKQASICSLTKAEMLTDICFATVKATTASQTQGKFMLEVILNNLKIGHTPGSRQTRILIPYIFLKGQSSTNLTGQPKGHCNIWDYSLSLKGFYL